MAKTKNSEHWTGLVKMGEHNIEHNASKNKRTSKTLKIKPGKSSCLLQYVVKNTVTKHSKHSCDRFVGSSKLFRLASSACVVIHLEQAVCLQMSVSPWFGKLNPESHVVFLSTETPEGLVRYVSGLIGFWSFSWPSQSPQLAASFLINA